MADLNWEIITNNLAEARQELQELEARLKAGDLPEDVEFQLVMQHIYHHLNFAWNIRHQPTQAYEDLTKQDFQRWGRFPADLYFENV